VHIIHLVHDQKYLRINGLVAECDHSQQAKAVQEKQMQIY
jgi:hypothetical protein